MMAEPDVWVDHLHYVKMRLGGYVFTVHLDRPFNAEARDIANATKQILAEQLKEFQHA